MIGTTEKGFLGFEQTRSTAAGDIESVLGIHIDPKIRIFEFRTNDELSRLGRLRRLVLKSRHEKPFLEETTTEDTVMRGVFLGEHKALLVRPNDMFAQYHELGHAYVHERNPQLIGEIAHIKQSGADASFAKYAFDEGVAQWIAINTDLGLQDPQRRKEGVYEHNRLVGKSKDEPHLSYDNDAVLQMLTAVRDSVKACEQDPIVKKDSDWETIAQKYADALVKITREAIAIGYVYAEALVKTFMEQPGFSYPGALALLARRPPSSLDQIEQEIKGFQGFDQDEKQ